MPRPKGQHSAPRGGPPRSWTNSELTEALQHVWNKKMTTSQASRIFGIPYNSLLMYVRGKYGKSLKLEQLRKDCISGPPLELLQMGVSGTSGSSGSNSNQNSGNSKKSSNSDSNREQRQQCEARNESHRNLSSNNTNNNSNNNNSNNNNNEQIDLTNNLITNSAAGPQSLGGAVHSSNSDQDLLSGGGGGAASAAGLFNPFNPQNFYPDFPAGFPGLPLSMLNLLPPASSDHHSTHSQLSTSSALHHNLSLDEDCKSDRSKQSSSLDEDYVTTSGSSGAVGSMPGRQEQRQQSSGNSTSGINTATKGCNNQE